MMGMEQECGRNDGSRTHRCLRSWSGYELTQQARRSLRFAWPRSERSLYSESKKLAAHGYATATDDPAGKRPRTTYAITDQGRQALQEWTGSQPAPPQVKIEALLRVLFAENGSLDVLEEDAADLHEQVTDINTGYLHEQHPFPERVHLSVLFATFQLEAFDLMGRWARYARSEADTWPQTASLGMTDQTRDTRHCIANRQPILEATPAANTRTPPTSPHR